MVFLHYIRGDFSTSVELPDKAVNMACLKTFIVLNNSYLYEYSL